MQRVPYLVLYAIAFVFNLVIRLDEPAFFLFMHVHVSSKIALFRGNYRLSVTKIDMLHRYVSFLLFDSTDEVKDIIINGHPPPRVMSNE